MGIFYSGQREKDVFVKFAKRLIISVGAVIVAIFIINGVAYYFLLNNELWMYFSGFIAILKYSTPLVAMLTFYYVKYLRSKDLYKESRKQADSITKDTEMLKMVNGG